MSAETRFRNRATTSHGKIRHATGICASPHVNQQFGFHGHHTHRLICSHTLEKKVKLAERVNEQYPVHLVYSIQLYSLKTIVHCHSTPRCLFSKCKTPPAGDTVQWAGPPATINAEWLLRTVTTVRQWLRVQQLTE
jgi:hypothetical protein